MISILGQKFAKYVLFYYQRRRLAKTSTSILVNDMVATQYYNRESNTPERTNFYVNHERQEEKIEFFFLN